MRRYLVFKGDHYYPMGGMSDFHSDWNTEAMALSVANNLDEKSEWSQVYDTVNMIFIKEW